MEKETLKNYLQEKFCNLFDQETIEHDGEIAIYYYAVDYNEGQFSDLYYILSQSDYKPRPFSSLSSEGEIVEMLYMSLVQKFEYCFHD